MPARANEWRERMVVSVREGDRVRGHDRDGYASEDNAFRAHRPLDDRHGGVFIGDHATGAYGLDEYVMVWTKVAKLAPIANHWRTL